MNYPCKDCATRTVGCHGTCEKYKTAKERFDESTKVDRFVIGAIAEMEIASMRRNRCNRFDRKWI